MSIYQAFYLILYSDYELVVDSISALIKVCLPSPAMYVGISRRLKNVFSVGTFYYNRITRSLFLQSTLVVSFVH